MKGFCYHRQVSLARRNYVISLSLAYIFLSLASTSAEPLLSSPPSTSSSSSKSSSSSSPSFLSPLHLPVSSLLLSSSSSLVHPSLLPQSGFPSSSSSSSSRQLIRYKAIINATYRSSSVPFSSRQQQAGEQRYEYYEGLYSASSRIDASWGQLKVVRSATNRTDGCEPITNRVEGPWVALIERGFCRFHQKIYNAAVLNNASAVIVYNDRHEILNYDMEHKVEEAVAIFIGHNDGLRLARLAENETALLVTIVPGPPYQTIYDVHSRTSVIFLFISFIVLAVVSLLWLIFYYVQRFRVHSSLTAERARKIKMAKHLTKAAKLAVSRMELKTLKQDDPELTSEAQLCAICVEEYRVNDVIRIPPCRHIFHKKCVDQWLLDKRRCPICQLDILKAAGIQVPEEFRALETEREVIVVVQDSSVNDSNNEISSDTSRVEYDGPNAADCILVNLVPSCSISAALSREVASTGVGRNADAFSGTTTYHSDGSGDGVNADGSGDKRVLGAGGKSSESSGMPSFASSTSSTSSVFNIKEDESRHDDGNCFASVVNDNYGIVVSKNRGSNSARSVNSALTGYATPCSTERRCRDGGKTGGRGDGRCDVDDNGNAEESLSSSLSLSHYYDCLVVVDDNDNGGVVGDRNGKW